MRILILLFALSIAACGSESDTTYSEDTDSEANTESLSNEADATAERLNLNTTSLADFQTIPDVGERMAHEFDEYRPYVSIQQFRQEIGKYVDEAQVAAYEAFVFVPVDPNASDLPTLAQLPGLDEEAAESLISGRPYADHDAFLEALSMLVSAGELEQASDYLTAP